MVDEGTIDQEATPEPDDTADEGAVPPEWPEEDDPNEQEAL